MKMNKTPNFPKTRVAVVGLGGRGAFLTRLLLSDPRFELAALCETDAGVLEAFKKSGGFEKTPGYSRVEDCLAGEQFEAMIIATPDNRHAEVAVPALQSGKFVFLEKPLEITELQCRRILEADRKAGGRTFVGFNLRFAPLYSKARELIDQGAVGKILTIQMDEFYNGGRTYFRRWNRLRKYGGGLWITKATHDFDLMYWLAGEKPQTVFAMHGKSYYVPRPDAAQFCEDCSMMKTCYDSPFSDLKNRGWNPADYQKSPGKTLCLYNADSDTFDHGIAAVEFGNSIFGTYTCNVVSGLSNRRLRVSGTAGTLDGSLSENKIVLERRDPCIREEVSLENTGGLHGGGDERIFGEFWEFTQGLRKPKVNPEEAMTAVLMGLAATRSGDEKRKVEMKEFEKGDHEK